MIGCKCLDKVDALLAEQGAALVISFMFPEMYCRTTIATERKVPRSRVKLKTLVANFCPFCGKKYPEKPKPKGREP